MKSMTQDDIKKLRALLTTAQKDSYFPWRWSDGDVAGQDFLGDTMIYLSSSYEGSREHCLLIQEALRMLPDLLDAVDPPAREAKPEGLRTGDVVKLKSGGPVMTMASVILLDWVTCAWFDSEETMHTSRFPVAGLESWT